MQNLALQIIAQTVRPTTDCKTISRKRQGAREWQLYLPRHKIERFYERKRNLWSCEEQFNAMIKYALQYLDVSKTEYRVVWRKLFDSSKSHKWKSALLLVELLFTLPASNAKVKQLFSLMKRIKTDARNFLSKDRFSSLLRVCIEGPSLQDFDPKPSMTLWNDAVVARRPNQGKRK